MKSAEVCWLERLWSLNQSVSVSRRSSGGSTARGFGSTAAEHDVVRGAGGGFPSVGSRRAAAIYSSDTHRLTTSPRRGRRKIRALILNTVCVPISAVSGWSHSQLSPGHRPPHISITCSGNYSEANADDLLVRDGSAKAAVTFSQPRPRTAAPPRHPAAVTQQRRNGQV